MFSCMNLVQDRQTGLIVPGGGTAALTGSTRIAELSDVQYVRLNWQGNTGNAAHTVALRVDWSPDGSTYSQLVPLTASTDNTQANIYSDWTVIDPNAKGGDIYLRAVYVATPTASLTINLAIMFYR